MNKEKFDYVSSLLSIKLGDIICVDENALTAIKKTAEVLSYHTPKNVTEYTVYKSNEIKTYCFYERCPRCGASISRTYQSFCDSCGQKLKWISRKKMSLTK